jgi:hypothetical protein
LENSDGFMKKHHWDTYDVMDVLHNAQVCPLTGVEVH